MDFLFFKKKYKEMNIPPPKLHLVLGSGFGAGLKEFEKNLTDFNHKLLSSSKKAHQNKKNWEKAGKISFSDLKTLRAVSVSGHEGTYHYFINKKQNQSLCVQSGRLHGYEGYNPKEVVRPLRDPFLAGTKKFILTNAAGALNPSVRVGSIMIIKDHVNLTGKNPLRGSNPKDEKGKALGPRFLDMRQAYDPALSSKLRLELKKQKLNTFDGIYLGLNGPSFETPAEIKLFQSWGLQAVGMSTVWEVIALRHMGAKVGALSLITNLGCGLSEEKKIKSKKNVSELNHLSFLSQFQHTSRKIIEACFNLKL